MINIKYEGFYGCRAADIRRVIRKESTVKVTFSDELGAFVSEEVFNNEDDAQYHATWIINELNREQNPCTTPYIMRHLAEIKRSKANMSQLDREIYMMVEQYGTSSIQALRKLRRWWKSSSVSEAISIQNDADLVLRKQIKDLINAYGR